MDLGGVRWKHTPESIYIQANSYIGIIDQEDRRLYGKWKMGDVHQ